MNSIRKFAYASLLAFTALNIAPRPASAQEPARGKFMLTHEVRWENAKLPAGEYEFSFDPQSTGRMLTLSKLSGPPSRYMLLVAVTDQSKASKSNQLLLKTTADGSYVSSMELPEFDLTLYFTVPSHLAPKEMAKAAPSVAAGQ